MTTSHTHLVAYSCPSRYVFAFRRWSHERKPHRRVLRFLACGTPFITVNAPFRTPFTARPPEMIAVNNAPLQVCLRIIEFNDENSLSDLIAPLWRFYSKCIVEGGGTFRGLTNLIRPVDLKYPTLRSLGGIVAQYIAFLELSAHLTLSWNLCRSRCYCFFFGTF